MDGISSLSMLMAHEVQHIKLGECIKLVRGSRLIRSQLSQDQGYPVYQNSLKPLGFHTDYNCSGNTTFIICAGAAGEVGYSKEEFWAADDCFYCKCPKTISQRYLYHVLLNKQSYLLGRVRKASIPRLSHASIESMIIPVPPIEIQERIVYILDSFTQLTAELTAELTARKKQYQAYIDKTIWGDRDYPDLITLSQIGEIFRGKRFVHADAVEAGVPCIHYGELYTYYGAQASVTRSFIREDLRPKMRYAHNGDVIIVGAGENKEDIGIGLAWLGSEDPAIHDACYIFRSKFDPRYVSYYLRSSRYHNELKKYVSEGKICSISAQSLEKMLIPNRPIDEQKRIADHLEIFEKLVTDMDAGIPAEIEARKKQYEYYRDKLLSFQEV